MSLLEQELGVLGGLLKRGTFDETITAHHFSHPLALRLFGYIGDCFEENGVADVTSVRQLCVSRGDEVFLSTITRAAMLHSEQQFPEIALKHLRYRHFLKMVTLEMNTASKMLQQLENSLSEKAMMNWVTSHIDKLTTLSSAVFDVGSMMPELPLGKFGEIDPEEVIDKSLLRNQSDEEKAAEYTAYPEVSQQTEMGESVWTIAAPTGLGKTSYVLYDAYHLAKAGRPVFYASTEMSEEQVIKRLIGIDQPLVPMSQLFQKTLEDKYEQDTRYSVRRMRDYPFFFLNGLGSVRSIANAAMRLNAFLLAGGRSLIGNTILVNDPRLHTVYIDYVQQTDLRFYSDMPSQALTEAMTDARRLSSKIKGRVVVVSQMNRKQGERPDKEPQLSDLKESSALEQMSNVVAFLHREDYFLPPPIVDEYGYTQKQEPKDPNSYLIVRKNRNNAPFRVALKFEAHRACYTPLGGEAQRLAHGDELDRLITSDAFFDDI